MICRTFMGIALILSLASTVAHATLGQAEATVDHDHKMCRGVSHKIFSKKGYRVHKLTTDIGVTINEYLGPKGIFAVSWIGSNEPNLTTLFGTYFTKYQKVSLESPHPHGRGVSTVTADDITVQLSGHFGNVSGRAWVTSFMPADFSPEDIE